MRWFGLDVHRDFCEVALVDEEGVRSAGRIATRMPTLELFAQSLGPGDGARGDDRCRQDRLRARAPRDPGRGREHAQAALDH